MTPEAKVKAMVRDILARYPSMYTYWPVPGGYGRPSIDCIACYRGRFFGIETKAKGKKPTLRQHLEMERMEKSMGKTFVIVGIDSPMVLDLINWLNELTETVHDDTHIPRDTVNRRTI